MTDVYTMGARKMTSTDVIIAIIEVNQDALVQIDDPHMSKGAEVPQLGQCVDINKHTRTKHSMVIINGWPRIKDATDHGRRMKAPI